MNFAKAIFFAINLNGITILSCLTEIVEKADNIDKIAKVKLCGVAELEQMSPHISQSGKDGTVLSSLSRCACTGIS